MHEKPLLNHQISPADFKSYYWHTEELGRLCKELGLDASGGKLRVTARILKYLEQGIKEEPVKKVALKKTEILGEVTAQTLIPENILLSENIRGFFEGKLSGTKVKKFRFTKELIAYFRSHPGRSMEEALAFYIDQVKSKPKKNPGDKIIPEQCQYNQFIRDFLADQKEGTFSDAVKAWKALRDTKSDFKYQKGRPREPRE